MSYEEAPATKMLATFCSVCSRPLLDAESVERGIGPVCAEKYGFLGSVAAEARAEANVLVHMIAVEQEGEKVNVAIERLRELGFMKLANAVERRTVRADIAISYKYLPVRQEETVTRVFPFFVVKAPFNPEFNQARYSITKAYFDKANKVHCIPANEKPALFAALRKTFPEGTTIRSPRGVMPLHSNEGAK